MSKLVTPQLHLNGEDFLPKHGYSATVEQALGGHSAFSISETKRHRPPKNHQRP